MVEIRSAKEHLAHVGHITHIPPASVLVESRSVLEGVGHVGDARDVPVTDVPVGGGSVGLVGEPQIDRGREIGVGNGRRGRGLTEGEAEATGGMAVARNVGVTALAGTQICPAVVP